MGEEVRGVGGGEESQGIGAMMRMMGALETIGGWCFQARHVPGVENRLADGITRWKEEEIADNLQLESPGTRWQVQELKVEEQQLCAEILREATHLGELQRRLEKITRGLGTCG